MITTCKCSIIKKPDYLSLQLHIICKDYATLECAMHLNMRKDQKEISQNGVFEQFLFTRVLAICFVFWRSGMCFEWLIMRLSFQFPQLHL